MSRQLELPGRTLRCGPGIWAGATASANDDLKADRGRAAATVNIFVIRAYQALNVARAEYCGERLIVRNDK